MKKHILPLLLVLAILGTLGLTACGGPSGDTKGISLVVILGYHANTCKPNQEMLEQSGLATLINHAIDYYKDSDGYCHAKANIKFILCDGQPEVIDLTKDGEPIVMHYEAGNFDVLKEDMRYLSQDIMDALQSNELMANDDEVDLLAALSMAGDLLRMDPGVQNRILVLDSGLNTAGLLKMQDQQTLKNLQEIGNAGKEKAPEVAKNFVDHMAKGAIADLDDIHVTFYGLGNVDNVTQTTITDQLVKDTLIHFWTAYFAECKATLQPSLVFTVNQGGTPMIYNSDGTGYPYVSNIPFVLSQDSFPMPGSDLTPMLVLNENKLGFNPSKATFRNRDTAVTEITNNNPFFHWVLEQNPDVTFYVVGSVAKKDPEHTKEKGTLSLERAEAVAQILVEDCGIPADRIMLIPAGLTRLKWRDNEEFPNGQKTTDSPSNQQKNRVVAIVPSTESDLMAELKGGNPEGVNLLDWAIPYSR